MKQATITVLALALAAPALAVPTPSFWDATEVLGKTKPQFAQWCRGESGGSTVVKKINGDTYWLCETESDEIAVLALPSGGRVKVVNYLIANTVVAAAFYSGLKEALGKAHRQSREQGCDTETWVFDEYTTQVLQCPDAMHWLTMRN